MLPETRGWRSGVEGAASQARTGGQGLPENAHLQRGWSTGTRLTGVGDRQEGGIEAAGESCKVRRGQKDPDSSPLNSPPHPVPGAGFYLGRTGGY